MGNPDKPNPKHIRVSDRLLVRFIQGFLQDSTCSRRAKQNNKPLNNLNSYKCVEMCACLLYMLRLIIGVLVLDNTRPRTVRRRTLAAYPLLYTTYLASCDAGTFWAPLTPIRLPFRTAGMRRREAVLLQHERPKSPASRLAVPKKIGSSE